MFYTNFQIFWCYNVLINAIFKNTRIISILHLFLCENAIWSNEQFLFGKMCAFSSYLRHIVLPFMKHCKVFTELYPVSLELGYYQIYTTLFTTRMQQLNWVLLELTLYSFLATLTPTVFGAIISLWKYD